MWRQLRLASLIFVGAQAFAPAPIQWGGLPKIGFVIAPANQVLPNNDQIVQLTVKNPSDMSLGEIPSFTANRDSTISWDSKNLCFEAGAGAKNGDAVRLAHCTGAPSQRWNWLPWGPIQLEGTNQCLDVIVKEGALSGAPIELRKCENTAQESWKFAEPLITLPTRGAKLKEDWITFCSLALLGVTFLIGWVWRWQKSARAHANGQQDGVSLSEPLAVRQRNETILPAVMAIETSPEEGGARVPEGTPVVPHLGIPKRPRRNRRFGPVREMLAETVLTPANFIYPLFVHDGTDDIPIASMPGQSRVGVDTGLLREVEEARNLGVKSVVIFPKTPDDLKTMTGEECFNPEGLAQRAIRNVKQHFPDVIVYTDVALDPYNSLGHDGIVRSDGVILNDETIHYLCKQAVSQAEAGADYVSPSDMMDGRVGAIREALDQAGFTDVGIMAYSAKYSSAFYGPFRDALDSNPSGDEGWTVPSNKDTYQQNPANYREALLEAALDEDEGADILMVKPAMPYLDVIKGLNSQSNLPIAAYHVSGEYAMLKAAAQNGWLNERAAVLEALLSIKRAGATVILTYYAKQAAEWLKEDAEK